MSQRSNFKAAFSEEAEIRLIELVRERPAIWKAAHVDHLDKNIVENLWKEISTETNVNGEFQ